RHRLQRRIGLAGVVRVDLEQEIEVDRTRPERLEPGVDEAVPGAIDFRAEQRGYLRQQRRVGLVDDTDRQLEAEHPPADEIGHFLRQQLGVADDPQLAGQRADTGGLEPDLLDRARYRALLALV